MPRDAALPLAGSGLKPGRYESVRSWDVPRAVDYDGRLASLEDRAKVLIHGLMGKRAERGGAGCRRAPRAKTETIAGSPHGRRLVARRRSGEHMPKTSDKIAALLGHKTGGQNTLRKIARSGGTDTKRLDRIGRARATLQGRNSRSRMVAVRTPISLTAIGYAPNFRSKSRDPDDEAG